MTSLYFKRLEILSQLRYAEKLKICGIELPDPLDLDIRETVFSDDTRYWPELTFGDTCMYLVESVCWYTKEQFRSYKSLDGYNLFCNGKIRKILSYCAPNKLAIVIAANVEAGQTLGKMYSPWIILDKTGKVLSAHCTCMAGLGEACSHIAALLFAVETTVKLELHKPSCTSVACKWKAVVQKVKPSKVSGINFIKPALKKRHRVYESVPVPSKKPSLALKLSNDVKRNLLKIVKEITETSHIQTMISDSEDTDSADSSDEIVESPSTTLHSLTTSSIYKDVHQDAVLNCHISNEHALLIERSTKEQSECQAWRNQRKGHITASYFGRVCKVKTGVDRLVLDILGESAAPEGLPSLQWGRRKEKDALVLFEKLEGCKHTEFRVTRSGLCVPIDKPYMGASPDGLINCSCCIDAVLEIKCPYSIRFDKIEKSCSKKSFFLDENGKLKTNHNYYFQVQGLMLVTGRKKCFFIVYTTVDTTIEVILFDENVCKTIEQKMESFFCKSIFPKL